GSEGPELDELSLEGSATYAIGARKRPPPKERTGLQAQNFVFFERGIGREIEPGAVVCEERVRSFRGHGSQYPAIDDFDVGYPRCDVAVGIVGPGICRDRARRPRALIARGAGGEEFGEAFVQSCDRIGEVFDGEDVRPPTECVPVDLDPHQALSVPRAPPDRPIREGPRPNRPLA